MRLPRIALTASIFLGTAGCAPPITTTQVAEPPKITLSEALIDVVIALHAAKARAERYDERLGLNPCSATAVFNVAAKATAGNQFTMGVTAGPPLIPVGASVGAAASQAAEASRGNQVTVLLTSAACIPDKSLGATHPDKIVEAQIEMNQAVGEAPLFTGTLRDVLEQRVPLQLESPPPDTTGTSVRP